MSNVYIKQVNGGQKTTFSTLDAIELDDGTTSTYILLTDLMKFPAGTMINGKISPTVSSNNLTLTLQTAAGSTPSSTDPVLININGTWRSVTSSLSVTLAAGTNWFNSGASILATKKVGYFVYLSYRAASSAVVIGFARIPYARLYSDFSATTTNEKYAGFSTAPASTDDVVNIGYFEATLSAGAGYTWTVPTFTGANLVQKPTFETNTLSWASTVTSSIGSPTTVSTTNTYTVVGRELHWTCDVTITTVGTAAGTLLITPVFTTSNYGGFGQEINATGYAISALHSTVVQLIRGDAVTLWVNGYRIIASGIALL